MKLYIVIIEDRHYDVDVVPFTDKDKAVAWARAEAIDRCRHKECYEEFNIDIFCAKFSAEDDYISVVERELDGEVNNGESNERSKA